MRNRMSRLFRFHQPRLETLEARLPPGDGFLGLLLTWPEIPSETHELEQELISAFALDECEIQALVISRLETHTEDHPSTATSSIPTDDSTVLRTAGLIPGVYTAGINPAALSAGMFNTDGITNRTSFAAPSFTRLAGDFSGGPIGTPSLARRVSMHINPTRERGEPDVDQSRVKENFGKLDLAFEENVGQTDSRVDFTARAGGYTAFLTPTGAVFSIQNPEESRRAGRVNALDAASLQGVDTPRSPESTTGIALHMEIVGANPHAVVGREQLPGKVNYFIGNDPSQWRSNISTCGRVEYDDVYPGIDLVYYGKDQQLEYDFIVSPGADPNSITLNFSGAERAEIDDGGNLVLHTAVDDVIQQKPYLYQEANGVRQEVAGSFVLDSQYSAPGTFEVTFDIGQYDASWPLVIDPLVLGYSTFLGGSGYEYGHAIAVDGGGNAYVTGYTSSASFPATAGAFDTTYNGGLVDAFVAKLNTDGSALAYATYLGGSSNGTDTGLAIAVDSSGNAYVTGDTFSTDFPTTPGAFDPTYSGGPADSQAFLTKLNASGSALVYSTYLGGFGGDSVGRAVAVNPGGNAYVGGWTRAPNFPTTPRAFDTTYNGSTDGFVCKLNTLGSALVYATFLGGGGTDVVSSIDLDGTGSPYVTGYTYSPNFPTTSGALDTTYNGDNDAFVIKLSATGSSLSYATFLGGSAFDEAFGIAVDRRGNASLSGVTQSADFPTTAGAFDTTPNGGTDVFVAKVTAAGSALVYGTFLGGSGSDGATSIGTDGGGNVFLTGTTSSADFPITPGAFDTTYNGGSDAFVARFHAAGSALIDSTFLGGSNADYGRSIAVDNSNSVYLTGFTLSTDLPVTPDALKPRNPKSAEGFVTKFVDT